MNQPSPGRPAAPNLAPRAPEVLMAATSTPINRLAGAMLKGMREYNYVIVRSIGAGALNQAMKAAAIARSMLLKDEGKDFVLVPVFDTVEVDGAPKTALAFRLEARDPDRRAEEPFEPPPYDPDHPPFPEMANERRGREPGPGRDPDR